MKKEVTLVPKDKPIRELMEEIRQKLKNSWVFIHTNVRTYLRENCDYAHSFTIGDDYSLDIIYDIWLKPPAIRISYKHSAADVWAQVIQATPVVLASNDPEEVIFLKMEE